jgi:radical SAM superfamily enzyme YgiQ (UPF0313 family)
MTRPVRASRTSPSGGEGERTLEELILRLGNGDGLRPLPGTSVLEDGEVIHAPPAPLNRHLGELPSPFLSGDIPIELFERGGAEPGSARYGRVLLETYRGCYMQCAYCQWGNGDNSRSAFPVERLHLELSWLLAQDVRTVFIVDAMFGYKKRAAIELLEFIAAERLRLDASTVFNVYHNQDFFDPALFDLYREANVVGGGSTSRAPTVPCWTGSAGAAGRPTASSATSARSGTAACRRQARPI